MSSKTRLKSMAKSLVSNGLFMRLIALVTIFSMSVIFYGFTDDEKEAEFKTISIIDAEQHYEVVTQSETVEEAIAFAGITLGENDIVSAELDAEIKDGDVIYLNRSKLIYLETSGKVFEFYTLRLPECVEGGLVIGLGIEKGNFHSFLRGAF